MMNTSPNQQGAKSAYLNSYACKANLQRLRRITVEEPLKPYADFQQLKMAKVKAEKIDHRKNINQKKAETVYSATRRMANKGGVFYRQALFNRGL